MQSGSGSVEAVIRHSKKLENEMKEIGLKIKHHEDNFGFLKVEMNKLDGSISDIQVELGQYLSESGTGSENKESSNGQNEEETTQQILKCDKSAAGIYCQLKPQIARLPSLKNVMGIVALLGKVDDDNLSRILSNYLGRETMLAVVCKTHDGLEALEKYDKDGFIDKSSGLHGLGASMGRPLNDRFVVICVQNLSPYAGEFIADDPEKKLSIKKPRYLNDEVPSGFIGFAVNMINIDSANLYCVTSTGHGLRETLFYKLFSRLQVYKTRADMLQALPVVTDGAVSLDGGIIKRYGVSFLGERDVEIKFPKSSGRSNLPENYFSTERQMKELKWKRERFFEDLQREQGLLDHAKLNFETKKREFIKFLEDSSSYVSAIKGKADDAAAVINKLLRSPKSEQLYFKYAHDILDAVPLLGEVRTHKLSRILSNYLRRETMLAVVCKTHGGLEALETYDKNGFIDKSSGLHGLGALMGRPLNDRFLVICLENLRLAMKKPRYLSDEVPSEFLGFAVNMINIDSANLYFVTCTGHELRETLFYKLFSRLQVYKTRADMLQALPVITDGAVSLDGGIIKSVGVSVLGERGVEIKFPTSSRRSNLPRRH